MDEQISPRMKLIAKRDFDLVRKKYTLTNADVVASIESAKPLDVLALKVVPGSGLKVLDVKILNENNEQVFADLLKEGFSLD